MKIELLIPLDCVMDDPFRGRSDRDDASAVLIFPGRDEVAAVDGSLHMDGIFGEIAKLKTEALSRTQSRQDHEAEGVPVEQIRRLK